MSAPRGRSRGQRPSVLLPAYYEDAEYDDWQHLNAIDEIMSDTRMFDVDT
ncbi:hypothetical protein [Natrinema sp. SYSU A 869]|nr:hypothetical protein [Natrinema sp. SYSU A 869]